MFDLPADFFQSLNLSDLPQEERDVVAESVLEELETKVGAKLSSDLSDSQFRQLEQLASGGDEGLLEQWLDQNCPGYGQIVDTALDEIKAELQQDPAKYQLAV